MLKRQEATPPEKAYDDSIQWILHRARQSLREEALPGVLADNPSKSRAG
ncbi:MAG TPA: hypothetical protein VMU94_26300 [Streptosporangiaceae bacterium]|nr:hypothetical protein [Streptosporangiaceae bacterium]